MQTSAIDLCGRFFMPYIWVIIHNTKKIMFELTLMVLFLFAVMAVFMLLAVFVEFVNDRFR